MNNKILVINTGSSSIKFQLFLIKNQNPEFQVLAKGLVERIGLDSSKINIEVIENNKLVSYEKKVNIDDHEVGAKLIIDQLKSLVVIKDFNEIVGVGHRLVHGGSKFKKSVIIDTTVEKAIVDSVLLAPLHNPAALKGYKAFKVLNPNVPHIAVFDTSFHMSLSQSEFLYSVPYSWYQKYQVRKYGFHGISYRYILSKLADILKKQQSNVNAIVCHLGNGASICAIKDGSSYNTTMGLTPLDGLIMGTRSGVIDPSIHEYVCEVTKNTSESLSINSITSILNKGSGLLGISEISSDIRDVVSVANDKNHPKHNKAKLAIEMFCSRIANYIIQYANDLDNKVDVLVFTAGIGENAYEIRKLIIDKIKLLSLKIDDEANIKSYQDYLCISNSDSSQIPIYKIRTNEEIIICQDTYHNLTLNHNLKLK